MKLRAVALAAALALPGVAHADPFTAVAFFVQVIAYAAPAVLTAAQAFMISAAITAVGAAATRRKARKAAAAQRAAYNASLQDRTVSVLRADPPWQIVYGRCRVGGAIVDIFSSDKTARKENGSTYTKADAYKHLVIVVAAHEVEDIHELYIDGVAVGTVDGNGWATGGDFYKAKNATRTVTFTTTTSIAEAAVEVLQAHSGTFGNWSAQTVTTADGGYTLNGPVGVEVTADYRVAADSASVRWSKHLGTASQTVDTYLNGVDATRYSTDHRLRGLAYVTLTLDLEDTRFQGGPPAVTFDVSGRKVYDPRLDSTVPGGSGAHRANDPSTWEWSANNALCIRDFLTAEFGYAVDPALVNTAALIAAANDCDALIDLTVGATTTEDQPTYTCNGSFTTDAALEATLEDLAESMAGSVVYGGEWQIHAGAWTAAAMALTDDDLHGQIEVVQADTSSDDLFNGVRGQYFAEGAASPSDFNPYQNATFVTADGAQLWTDVTLPYTDNLARARNLCRQFVERNRSGLVIRYPAKLRAWTLQVGDRVTVTSSEYGFSAKLFRVTDWQFDVTSPVVLTLQEDADTIYDLADAAVADPTPNTDLPDPWSVAAMSSVAAASGNANLLRNADGTVLPRVLVTWTRRTDANVVNGGAIEVSWRLPSELDWRTLEVAGDEAQAYILGLRSGDPVVIQVVARNGLGVRSAPTIIVHTVSGKSDAPGNVAGLSASGGAGMARVTWTASTEEDYAHTELRTGASWAAGTLLAKVAGSSYSWAVATAGGYTVWAKHFDRSGNESATAQSASVTVTAAGTKVYVQTSQPTGEVDGDMWFDSDDGYKPYRFNGSTWSAFTWNTAALAVGAATSTDLDTADSWGVGNPPAGGATSAEEDVVSVSWANNTGAGCVVQFECGYTDSTLAYNSSMPTDTWAKLIWSSASLSGTKTLQTVWPDSATSSLTSSSGLTWQDTLPDGETITVKLRVRVYHSAAAMIAGAHAYARLAAIKR